MKKLVSLFSVLLISFFSYGQQKRYGITVQLNSPNVDEVKLALDIENENTNYNYSFDDWYNKTFKSFSTGITANYTFGLATIRLRTGITKAMIEYSKHAYFSGYDHNHFFTGELKRYYIAPGITWRLTSSKLEFFGGFEIPFNIHRQDITEDIHIRVTSTSQTLSSYNVNTKVSNGYSVGVGALMGFNYFPLKWFSIGAEFSFSQLYSKLVSNSILTKINYFPYNPREPIQYIFTDKGACNESRFSINATIWFPSKNSCSKWK